MSEAPATMNEDPDRHARRIDPEAFETDSPMMLEDGILTSREARRDAARAIVREITAVAQASGDYDHGYADGVEWAVTHPSSTPAGPAQAAPDLWAAIRQRDSNINAFFAALKSEEDGLRDVEGLRMGDVAMAFRRLREKLRMPTTSTVPSTDRGGK